MKLKLDKKWGKELLHYIVVFGILAGSWTHIMEYFGGEIIPTVITGFVVFVVSDQLAHKLLLGEKTLLEG